jgi:hypothetical protein
LGCVSVAGTAVYAASFTLCDSRRTLAPLASAIGIAAGIAWVGFGLLIRAIDGPRRLGRWIDACLRTQTIGVIVLLFAAAANAIVFAGNGGLSSYPMFPVFVVVHWGLLILADVLMGARFVAEAAAISGVSRRGALVGWIIGLNGIFAAALAALVEGRILS